MFKLGEGTENAIRFTVGFHLRQRVSLKVLCFIAMYSGRKM